MSNGREGGLRGREPSTSRTGWTLGVLVGLVVLVLVFPASPPIASRASAPAPPLAAATLGARDPGPHPSQAIAPPASSSRSPVRDPVGPRPPTELPSAAPGKCTLDGDPLPPTLGESYNTTTQSIADQCLLDTNLTIAAGAQMTIWYPYSVLVNTTNDNPGPSYDNSSGYLVIDPGATLELGETTPQPGAGVAYLQVENGAHLRLVVLGTLEIVGSAGLWLSSNSTLVLGPTGRIVLRDGALYAPLGSGAELAGGSVLFQDGSTWAGGTPPSPAANGATSHPQWGDLKEGGALGDVVDSGTPVANLTLGQVGNLSIESTTVSRLNITVSAVSLSLQGFYSAPESVTNLTVQQVGTFRADDADLDSIYLTTVGTADLGNATSTPDRVLVTGLTIESSVGNLSLAHATVNESAVSKALRVSVVNSTLANSNSVTQATESFSANGTSRFGFPLVFNNAPRVNLTNVTAPQIEVVDLANVTVNDWPYTTTLTGPSTGTLPSISVTETSVVVHVNRYLLVRAAVSGSSTLPAGTTVTLCDTLVTVPCTSAPVNAQGYLGLFVPTDVVSTIGVDAFLGTYQVTVSAPGYASAQTTVTVTSDDVNTTLTLTAPVVPLQLIPIFTLELGALAVIVAAIVYLRTLTRRIRRPRQVRKVGEGTSEPEDVEEPEEEGGSREPAKEWRAPKKGPSTAPSGPSADHKPGQERQAGGEK